MSTTREGFSKLEAEHPSARQSRESTLLAEGRAWKRQMKAGRSGLKPPKITLEPKKFDGQSVYRATLSIALPIEGFQVCWDESAGEPDWILAHRDLDRIQQELTYLYHADRDAFWDKMRELSPKGHNAFGRISADILATEAGRKRIR
jgi:hypothetical protein